MLWTEVNVAKGFLFATWAAGIISASKQSPPLVSAKYQLSLVIWEWLVRKLFLGQVDFVYVISVKYFKIEAEGSSLH